MKPVAMGLGEQYSALQRGLIDVSGAGPNIMLFVIKVPEVTKYLITPSWGTAPASFIMNLKKWNEIPADLQELFIKTMYELAPATQIKRGKIESMYVNKMLEQGMTKIEFTGAERDKYLQTVEKATYEYYKKLAPVDGPKLYELLTQ